MLLHTCACIAICVILGAEGQPSRGGLMKSGHIVLTQTIEITTCETVGILPAVHAEMTRSRNVRQASELQ
jgi:hypothetical protein